MAKTERLESLGIREYPLKRKLRVAVRGTKGLEGEDHLVSSHIDVALRRGSARVSCSWPF